MQLNDIIISFQVFGGECDSLKVRYMCVCAYNYENGRINGERDQRKRLIQFLRGHDECYANVSGQILLMSPIPIVAKAYSMIRQKEKQKEGYSLKTTPNTALSSHLKNSMNTYNNNSRFERNYNSSETSSINYSQNKSSAKRGNYRKGVICGNYGKEWHTKEECYKIVRLSS
ncbi:hypothetical protein Tco_0917006 [Tanacetum coccineum]